MIRRASSRPRLVSDADQDFRGATVEVADEPYISDDLSMGGYGHRSFEEGPDIIYDGGSYPFDDSEQQQPSLFLPGPPAPAPALMGKWGSSASVAAVAGPMDDFGRRSTLLEGDDLSEYLSCYDATMGRSSSLLDLQDSCGREASLFFDELNPEPNWIPLEERKPSAANLAGLSSKRKRPSQIYLTPKSSYASLSNALHAPNTSAGYAVNNVALVGSGNGHLFQPTCVSYSRSCGQISMKQLQLPLDLPEETLVHAASFLPLRDVRALAAVCRTVRATLAASRGANQSIWEEALCRAFPRVFWREGEEDSPATEQPHPGEEVDRAELRRLFVYSKQGAYWRREFSARGYICASDVTFVDDCRLSIPGLQNDAGISGMVNLPLLSGLLPSRYPQGVDPATLYGRVDMLRYRIQFRSYLLAVGEDNAAMDEGQDSYDEADVLPVLQFTGNVGTGDRCIRSDRPFPPNCAKLSCSCEHAFGGSLTSWVRNRAGGSKKKSGKSRGISRGRASQSRGLSFRTSSSLSTASAGAARERPFIPTGVPFVAHVPPVALVPGQHSPLFRFLSSLSQHCTSPESTPRSSYMDDDTSHTGEDEEKECNGLVSKCRQCLGKLRRNSSPCDGMRPFVIPTVISNGSDGKGTVVDVTPRMVAYFEVTLVKRGQDAPPPSTGEGGMELERPGAHGLHGLPVDQHLANRPLHLRRLELIAHRVRQRHECVAIGLSTDAFDTRDRMPGWDTTSYGYHGDDGGIFHGHGDMLRPYGPSFGPGDTVGCGLEYGSRRIFFTKNGQFLGHAFEKVGKEAIEKGLYPTVGVDTECPIYMNYGERPFRFDLRGFVATAAEEVN